MYFAKAEWFYLCDVIRHARYGKFCGTLEGSIDIDFVLGRRLEVRDIVMFFTPQRCCFRLYGTLVSEVDLVAKDNEGVGGLIGDVGLYEKLAPPSVEVLEGLGDGDVEHEDATVRFPLKKSFRDFEISPVLQCLISAE